MVIGCPNRNLLVGAILMPLAIGHVSNCNVAVTSREEALLQPIAVQLAFLLPIKPYYTPGIPYTARSGFIALEAKCQPWNLMYPTNLRLGSLQHSIKRHRHPPKKASNTLRPWLSRISVFQFYSGHLTGLLEQPLKA